MRTISESRSPTRAKSVKANPSAKTEDRQGSGATLIAVVGISPAVLTKTVWVLANPLNWES